MLWFNDVQKEKENYEKLINLVYLNTLQFIRRNIIVAVFNSFVSHQAILIRYWTAKLSPKTYLRNKKWWIYWRDKTK